MERRIHLGLNHFEKINWLPVKNRVDQCIVGRVYNFKNRERLLHIFHKYLLNSSPVVRTRKPVDGF